MTWPTAVVLVVAIVACLIAYGWHLDRQPDEYDDRHDEIIDWFSSANGIVCAIYADGTVGALRRASDGQAMQIDSALGLGQQRANGSISGGSAACGAQQASGWGVNIAEQRNAQRELPFPPIEACRITASGLSDVRTGALGQRAQTALELRKPIEMRGEEFERWLKS